MGKNMPKARKVKAVKEKTTIKDKKDKALFNKVKVMLLQKIKADVFIRYRVIKICLPP